MCTPTHTHNLFRCYAYSCQLTLRYTRWGRNSWTVEKSWWDSWQEKPIFLFSIPSRPVLGPVQPRIQWIMRLFSCDKSSRVVGLTIQSHLVPKLRMSRVLTPLPHTKFSPYFLEINFKYIFKSISTYRHTDGHDVANQQYSVLLRNIKLYLRAKTGCFSQVSGLKHESL